MRIIITFLIVIYAGKLTGQEITGKYHGNYGCTIEIREDSTYRFIWRFDLASSWTIGNWSRTKNELRFHQTLVFDTLKRPNEPDSLVLSKDENSSAITNLEFVTSLISSGGQNNYDSPTSLLIRGKRLYYRNEKGRVIKKKPRGISGRKYKPWYTKEK